MGWSDMNLDVSRLSGYLVWCESPSQIRSDLEAKAAVYSLDIRTLWFHHYIYETAGPILRVDDPQMSPPFQHQIIICWGRSGLLALGVRHHVIDHLLNFALGAELRSSWRRSTINVQALVEQRLNLDLNVIPKPQLPPLSTYDISHLSAKTEGYRGNVRSLSLYGDNVVYAPFLNKVGKLECTSCTLKNETGEVLSIGADGYISFRVPRDIPQQLSRLKEIMAILEQLRASDLLIL